MAQNQGFWEESRHSASKVPVIIHTFHGHHFHSYYNRFISAALIKIEEVLSRFTTVIIAISACQKKELTEVYRIISSEKVKNNCPGN
jgi:hypothetical protein